MKKTLWTLFPAVLCAGIAHATPCDPLAVRAAGDGACAQKAAEEKAACEAAREKELALATQARARAAEAAAEAAELRAHAEELAQRAAREGQAAAQQAVREMIDSGELRRITESALREARHAALAFTEGYEAREGEEAPLGALAGGFARNVVEEVLASLAQEDVLGSEQLAQLERVLHEGIGHAHDVHADQEHEHEHEAHQDRLEHLERVHVELQRERDQAERELERKREEMHREGELRRDELDRMRRDLEREKRDLERARRDLGRRIEELERQLERSVSDRAPEPPPAPDAPRVEPDASRVNIGGRAVVHVGADGEHGIFFSDGDADTRFLKVGTGGKVVRIDQQDGRFVIERDGERTEHGPGKVLSIRGEVVEMHGDDDGDGVYTIRAGPEGVVRLMDRDLELKVLTADGTPVARTMTVSRGDGAGAVAVAPEVLRVSTVRSSSPRALAEVYAGAHAAPHAVHDAIHGSVHGELHDAEHVAPPPAPGSVNVARDVADEVRALMREMRSEMDRLRTDLRDLRDEMHGAAAGKADAGR